MKVSLGNGPSHTDLHERVPLSWVVTMQLRT